MIQNAHGRKKPRKALYSKGFMCFHGLIAFDLPLETRAPVPGQQVNLELNPKAIVLLASPRYTSLTI